MIISWHGDDEHRGEHGTAKAAEDSRAPKPGEPSVAQSVATASWSAAVLCRFDLRSLAGGIRERAAPSAS